MVTSVFDTWRVYGILKILHSAHVSNASRRESRYFMVAHVSHVSCLLHYAKRLKFRTERCDGVLYDLWSPAATRYNRTWMSSQWAGPFWQYGVLSQSTHYRSFLGWFYGSDDLTNSAIALKDDSQPGKGPIPPGSVHRLCWHLNIMTHSCTGSFPGFVASVGLLTHV